MTAAMPELDVFTCPLDCVNLIEASAGTGKTWNICALYVRLLLEKSLDVESILVVTFTKAATAELRERVRDRLVGLVHALQAVADGSDEEDALRDPFVAQLFDTVIGVRIDADVALLRLRRALSRFDQAAIHTIHAFCQRALQEAPFAAGSPFEFETSANDDAPRFTLAADFWRERVEPLAALTPGFAAWLVSVKAGPPTLDAHLSRRLKKPLARLCWDGMDHSGIDSAADAAASGVPVADVLPALYRDACQLWSAERDAIRRRVDESMGALSGVTYKVDAVTTAFADWDRYFADGDSGATPAGKSVLLCAATLAARVRKGALPPQHRFFDLADEIFAVIERLAAQNRACWLRLLREWLEWAPDELRRRKRVARTMSFDDLLAGVHDALRSHPWLARAIRERYPAALIDEFQDTDPLQFDIFSRIYGVDDTDGDDGDGDTRGDGSMSTAPLFLVGDPKQAIYAFRAADLHTYLRARERASQAYTLAVNRRSMPGVVAAVNRLFEVNPAAFILDGLDYRPVRDGRAGNSRLVDLPAQDARLAVNLAHDGRAGHPDHESDDLGDAASVESPMAGLIDHSAEFRIWMLPEDAEGAPLGKGAAGAAAARACAAEIVRLLRGARSGTVSIGDVPLSGADIAVLVQTHRQGGIVKRALAALGVASVELAQASVFATPDAENFERVLLAIEAPGDLRRVRAALASDWLGVDAATLWRMQTQVDPATEPAPSDATEASAIDHADEAMQWVERLTRYRALWTERGFAVMWRAFAREMRVLQRVAAQADGERRLTDINHLAELLQSHAVTRDGIAPVLRWLATQRASPGGGEEAQLRLESDRDLVQIVTVHKSKGLEYAIVFCPFLYDNAQRPTRTSGAPDAHEYHDEAGDAVIDYGCDEAAAERAKRDLSIEQAAERARVVYVALTRAVHRCYVVAGLYGTGRHASTKEARQGVLNWLVAGAGRPFREWVERPAEDAEVEAAWRLLDGSVVSVVPLPEATHAYPLGALHDATAGFTARHAARMLRESWRMSSFTSLMAAADNRASPSAALPMPDPVPHGIADDDAAEPQAGDARPDHDEHALSLVAFSVPGFDDDGNPAWFFDAGVGAPAGPEAEWDAVSPAPDDILLFPRGPAAGDCLHRMFELADFASTTGWAGAIDRALRERPVVAGAQANERLVPMMKRLLADVTSTELMPSFTLAQVGAARRLTELEFTFSMRAAERGRALGTLLAQHGYTLPALEDGAWRGFMKGFVDLVFEHRGRYWIVDWKSNYLGDTAAHYAPSSLVDAMNAHGYRLQALIYAVALDRYLRGRLAGYDYATHFGGCLYLFVRGVRPDWRIDGHATGVHLERPDEALHRSFDALLGGLG